MRNASERASWGRASARARSLAGNFRECRSRSLAAFKILRRSARSLAARSRVFHGYFSPNFWIARPFSIENSKVYDSRKLISRWRNGFESLETYFLTSFFAGNYSFLDFFSNSDKSVFFFKYFFVTMSDEPSKKRKRVKEKKLEIKKGEFYEIDDLIKDQGSYA